MYLWTFVLSFFRTISGFREIIFFFFFPLHPALLVVLSYYLDLCFKLGGKIRHNILFGEKPVRSGGDVSL